jgi:hypothetical protein
MRTAVPLRVPEFGVILAQPWTVWVPELNPSFVTREREGLFLVLERKIERSGL